MAKFVSYVSDEAIEKDAQALLAEYAHARGVKVEAPIEIDDIIEKHLKIGIEFDDTHRLFGVPRSSAGFDPEILGAIFFDQKRIVIDESLDPDANPSKEGRYRYTAAHEVGHWRLHRGLFGKDPAQSSLFLTNALPSVICRSSQAKAADRTAGRPLCLLCAIAAQAGLCRLGRSIPRPQAAGTSTFRADGPSLRRDRTLRVPRSRRRIHRKRRSGARKLRYAFRRKVSRFADRDAHPARKARAAAAHGSTSAAFVRSLVSPFLRRPCSVN
jgi:hypothetical protein